MFQSLLCCSFDMEPRILICNSFENWHLYVRARYKRISEWYQGSEILGPRNEFLKYLTWHQLFPVLFNENNTKQKCLWQLQLITPATLWGLNCNKKVYFYNLRYDVPTRQQFSAAQYYTMIYLIFLNKWIP